MIKQGLYPPLPVVVVGDRTNGRLHTERQLREAGIDHLSSCDDPNLLPALFDQQPAAAAVLNLDRPVDSETLLRRLRANAPRTPLIVVTRTREVGSAVRCIRAGASDYLLYPDDAKRLPVALKTLLTEFCQHYAAPTRNTGEAETPKYSVPIVGHSAAIRALLGQVESIAASAEPLLITGEAGVGKKRLARALAERGGRQLPLIELDVAAATTAVDNAALTDAARRAAGGVLYLADVAELSGAAQRRLAQLLRGRDLPRGDAGEITGPDKLDDAIPDADAEPWRGRLVCATRVDLWRRVRAGDFRTDLNFRIRHHHLHMPPLRERRSDVPLLLRHFLAQRVAEQHGRALTVPDELWALLADYEFPGNVAELQMMVRNAVSMSVGADLDIAPIVQHIAQQRRRGGTPGADRIRTTMEFPERLPTLKAVAEMLLSEALKRAHGNQSVAGRMLGISQQAVSKRLKTMAQNF